MPYDTNNLDSSELLGHPNLVYKYEIRIRSKQQ